MCHAQPESGAILLYLAEAVGGVTSLEERAQLMKWVFFANTTLVGPRFCFEICSAIGHTRLALVVYLERAARYIIYDRLSWHACFAGQFMHQKPLR